MTATATVRRASNEERARSAEARAAKAAESGYATLTTRGAMRTSQRPNGGARSLAFPSEIRAKLVDRNGQQRYHLHGEATVFDTPYEMWDMFGPYDEVVEKTALDKSLAADPDVAFLVNHKGVTMARTTNGTLELEAAKALLTDAYVNPKRTDVKDLVTAVEDGDITEMSFAFMLLEGWWSDDFTTFKISEADINRGDVSAVNYGANPYTSIAARQQELLNELECMTPELARVALNTLLSRRELDLDYLFDRVDATREVEEKVTEEVTTSADGAKGRSIALIQAILEA